LNATARCGRCHIRKSQRELASTANSAGLPETLLMPDWRGCSTEYLPVLEGDGWQFDPPEPALGVAITEDGWTTLEQYQAKPIWRSLRPPARVVAAFPLEWPPSWRPRPWEAS